MLQRLCIATVLVVFSSLAHGAITIESGPVANQVVQCDEQGKAELHLAGTSESAQGHVDARVRRGRRVVVGWTELSAVADSRWEGSLADVPAGGPYIIELRAGTGFGRMKEEHKIENVFVGDLWLLAGQSNMQGVGNNEDVEEPDPRVLIFAMNDTWRVAEEPIHRLPESRDIVHSKVEDDAERAKLVMDVTDWTKGAGLGLPFAKAVAEATGRPIGLVPCAHGGTSMTQWSPEGRDQGGATLYGAMYRRFQEVGGKVKGVLWYQGESDSTDEAAPEYFRKFSEFIEAVRRDFEQPELPFYYVQIGRLTVTDNPLLKNWNRIQMDQLRLESALPNVGMVATVDLSMDDLIHIGTPGLKVVGHRLANRVLTDVYKIRNDDLGPRPVKAVRGTTKFGNVVKVIYEVGNGGLSSEGRLAGFSISDGQGNPLALIYNQTIDPSGEAVLLWVQGEVPEDAQLSYGRGGDPYCNLGDGAGYGAPVFGPVPIEKE